MNAEERAQRLLAHAVGNVLELKGRFGIALCLTAVGGSAAAQKLDLECLDNLMPLIEKYSGGEGGSHE